MAKKQAVKAKHLTKKQLKAARGGLYKMFRASPKLM